MGVEPFVAGRWQVDRPAYFADRTCVNSSSLKIFRRSRMLYFQQFVTGQIEAQPPSPAMRLGTWVHTATLEPENWLGSVLVADPGVTRRHKAFTELAEFGVSVGKDVLTVDDAERVEQMAAALRDDQLVGRWLAAPREAEVAVRWLDPESGVPCKALLDWPQGGVLIDLKTATEPWPGPWARQAANLEYHCQAAHYRAGAVHGLGWPLPDFIHAVVGSEPPFEVFVYELDPEDLAFGARLNAESLDALARCRATGNWDTPGRGQVTRVRLPRWATSETTT